MFTQLNTDSADSEKIAANYNKFVEYISADERSDQIMNMYTTLGDRLILAPASGKTHYHNAFPGGYLDHILRVTEIALHLSGLYKKMNGSMTFTKQEVVFAALHHDLGKLGTEEGPYYVNQESDWHRKRGELYTQNEAIQYFKAPERGLMMLQKHGIKITEQEWLSIKLSDGLYDEGNKSYLMNHARYPMKTNMPYIIHWADHMACRLENDSTLFVV
jgi:hypothetical protein